MQLDAKGFGERIAKQRKRLKMTQEELAKQIGVKNVRYIQRLEHGQRICSVDLLVELSETLCVSVDYLLTGRETKRDVISNGLLSIINQLAEIVRNI